MVPFDLERRVGQIPPVSLFRVFALSRRVSVGLETAFPLCGNVVEFNLRFSLEIVCFHPGAACASLVARTCCSRCSRARCSRAARRADRCTPDGVPGAPMRRTGGLLAFSRAVCLELASGSWVAQRDESTKQTKNSFGHLVSPASEHNAPPRGFAGALFWGHSRRTATLSCTFVWDFASESVAASCFSAALGVFVQHFYSIPLGAKCTERWPE